MAPTNLHDGSRSVVDAETERQKTALVFRNAGIAQSVHVVNATLLAYVNATFQVSPGVAFTWCALVVAIAAGRYLLARRFRAAEPDAAAAMRWRRRYFAATTTMGAAWGAGTVLFMWNAPDGARMFTGLVLSGMVAGAVPLLAPIPLALRTFAGLVVVPMSAVVLLQAASPLHWAFGSMSLVFLVSVLASGRYLHETLDVAIRLGLEQQVLKAAVEQSSASIVVTDAEARIIFVNSSFTRITGYSPEEAIGQNPRLLKSGTMPKEIYDDLWASIGNGRPWHGELCNKTKGGELYWEAASISPIVDARGRISNFVAVLDDINQRKQVETALQEQKNFLAAILETEPECVTVVGADGAVLQMNGAGLAMLEADSVEEVNSHGLANFVVPEHRAAYTDLARRVFGGDSGVLELRVEGTRGTRRWVETHSAPLRDSSGRITHLLGVIRDITRKQLAEERLALSMRASDLAITDWHVPSHALVFGDGWSKLLGYQLDELPPHVSTLAGLLNAEDAPAARRALVRHLKGETPYFEVELRLRHKDGHWVWVLGRGMAVERTAEGRALRLAGTAMDITERKRAGADIARLSEWNELLLNSAGEGIYGADRDGTCTFINPAALALLGFDKDEVLGKNAHQVFHHHRKDGAPYPPEDCPISLTRDDGIRRAVEDAFIRKDGEVFPVHMSVTPMHEHGQLVGVAVVFQDIARRKALEMELTRLATTDPLTGVANRRRFIEELEMELARIRRFGRPAALLMVDIDHFKGVNDTHGHAIGDAVLQHLAELSRHRLRAIDLFGRLGGEEFGILLPGTDAAGAWKCAESLRRHVAETPLQSSRGAIPFTVSIGLTVFESGDDAPDGVLARADAALYRAKLGGRNRVEAS